MFNFGGLLTCPYGAIPYQVSAVNPDAFPGVRKAKEGF